MTVTVPFEFVWVFSLTTVLAALDVLPEEDFALLEDFAESTAFDRTVVVEDPLLLDEDEEDAPERTVVIDDVVLMDVMANNSFIGVIHDAVPAPPEERR